jgi:hypothetical protein
MAKLKMRGAHLAHCVIQSNKEGGVFLRINGRADYTKEIREENGWVELPDRSKNMDLEGEYAGGLLTLTGDQQTLGGGAPTLTLDFDQLTTFRAVRVKDKDQESSRVELRFHVISLDPNAAALCQAYKSAAKKSLGIMEISIRNVGERVTEPAADPKQTKLVESEPERISNADAMKIGKRGRRLQVVVAAAAEDPDHSANDATQAAIAASLGETDGREAAPFN